MTPEIRSPLPVRRLRVIWRDGQWSVESETRIDSMTLPKSRPLPEAPEGGIAGFWYEILDEQGRALYREGFPNPFSTGMEMFNEDGTISRHEAMLEEVSFDVLIPDLPEAAELHFYSDTLPSKGKRAVTPEGPAVRVGVIELREDREGPRGRR